MPGRSGDYDAGEMVRGSMIGKKLFGGSRLPTEAGRRDELRVRAGKRSV
jgi:hypothetical protein